MKNILVKNKEAKTFMVNIETITWVEDSPEKGIDVFFSNRNGILNIVEVSF